MVFHYPIATAGLAAVAGIAILPWPLNTARISLLHFGLAIVGAALISHRRKSTAREVGGGQDREVTDEKSSTARLVRAASWVGSGRRVVSFMISARGARCA